MANSYYGWLIFTTDGVRKNICEDDLDYQKVVKNNSYKNRKERKCIRQKRRTSVLKLNEAGENNYRKHFVPSKRHFYVVAYYLSSWKHVKCENYR